MSIKNILELQEEINKINSCNQYSNEEILYNLIILKNKFEIKENKKNSTNKLYL